jgi:hypothetical protein
LKPFRRNFLVYSKSKWLFWWEPRTLNSMLPTGKCFWSERVYFSLSLSVCLSLPLSVTSLNSSPSLVSCNVLFLRSLWLCNNNLGTSTNEKTRALNHVFESQMVLFDTKK